MNFNTKLNKLLWDKMGAAKSWSVGGSHVELVFDFKKTDKNMNDFRIIKSRILRSKFAKINGTSVDSQAFKTNEFRMRLDVVQREVK